MWPMLGSAEHCLGNLLHYWWKEPLFHAYAWDVRDAERPVAARDMEYARWFNGLLREFSGIVLDTKGLLAACGVWRSAGDYGMSKGISDGLQGSMRGTKGGRGITLDVNPVEIVPCFWLAPHDALYQPGGYNVAWESRISTPDLYCDTSYWSEGRLPFNCCHLLHEALFHESIPLQSLRRVGKVTAQLTEERQVCLNSQ